MLKQLQIADLKATASNYHKMCELRQNIQLALLDKRMDIPDNMLTVLIESLESQSYENFINSSHVLYGQVHDTPRISQQ